MHDNVWEPLLHFSPYNHNTDHQALLHFPGQEAYYLCEGPLYWFIFIDRWLPLIQLKTTWKFVCVSPPKDKTLWTHLIYLNVYLPIIILSTLHNFIDAFLSQKLDIIF